MQAKAIVLLLLSAVLAVSFTEAAIGPDIASSIKIVSQFCRPFHHSTLTAMRFFACYDGVTGREHFLKCQRQVFGANPNTMLRAEILCINTNRGTTGWDQYYNCITGEFKNANIDQSVLVATGTHINQCQAGVVGVQ